MVREQGALVDTWWAEALLSERLGLVEGEERARGWRWRHGVRGLTSRRGASVGGWKRVGSDMRLRRRRVRPTRARCLRRAASLRAKYAGVGK